MSSTDGNKVSNNLNDKPRLWKNPLVTLGSGLLIGTLVAGGIGMAVNNSKLAAGEINTGANAKTVNTWHQIDEVPEGFVLHDMSTDSDPLAIARSNLSAENMDTKCTYTVYESMFEKPEFEGVTGEYIATNSVLNQSMNRGAKNPVFSYTAMDTSEGEVVFSTATYELNYDIDGDGKPNNVKEAKLAHAYPEVSTDEGVVPVTEISYTCHDSAEWKEETFKQLLNATVLNISGDTPKLLNQDDPNSKDDEGWTNAENPTTDDESSGKPEKTQKEKGK